MGIYIFGLILVLAGVVSRLIPHPPNVAAVAALALVGGIYLDRRLALVLPLAAMVLSDVIIGFHSLTPFVYGGFILTVLIGMSLRNAPRVAGLVGGSFAGSLLFFLITNAGVWLLGDGVVYPKTPEGLLACYVAGVPFFRNSLLGDLMYTGILAGTFELGIHFGLKTSLSRSHA